MSKHTPGPWMMAASPSSIVGWPIVSRNDGRAICNIHYAPKEMENADKINIECEANGHVIAAAPELLEALQEATELAEAHGWAPAHRIGWAKIIAKATGEKP